MPVTAITLDALNWQDFRDIYAALRGDGARRGESGRCGTGPLTRLVTVLGDVRAQYGVDARLVIA
ncbi:hypothetical protein [uncultured Sphingomonas sp.]|uniref:hypothetical protein n=1 Tax=uncultured Sphingomonas sp. TaxID=158754 RepID=UPI0025D82A91|nr:hypothetical protein [uncultured Sphingomonas sp.]